MKHSDDAGGGGGSLGAIWTITKRMSKSAPSAPASQIANLPLPRFTEVPDPLGAQEREVSPERRAKTAGGGVSTNPGSSCPLGAVPELITRTFGPRPPARPLCRYLIGCCPALKVILDMRVKLLFHTET